MKNCSYLVLGLLLLLSGCTKDENPVSPNTTGTLQGIVLQPDTDAPVQGVTVSMGNSSQLTASDGSFYMPKLKPGIVTVTFYKEQFFEQVRQFYIQEGKILKETIYLYPAGSGVTVTLLVRHAENGNPVKNATVHIDSVSGTTDMNGIVRLYPVPPGNRTLWSEAAGYLKHSQAITIPYKDTSVTLSMQKGTNFTAAYLSKDTVLTAANSPYYFTSDLQLLSGAHLIIAPGAELRFAPNTALRIPAKANLTAKGTEIAPIRFAAGEVLVSQGDWNGIIFEKEELGTSFILNNVIISRAKNGITLGNSNTGYNSSLQISGIVIRDCDVGIRAPFLQIYNGIIERCNYGIIIERTNAGDAKLITTELTVRDCSQSGIVMQQSDGFYSLRKTSIIRNRIDGITVIPTSPIVSSTPNTISLTECEVSYNGGNGVSFDGERLILFDSNLRGNKQFAFSRYARYISVSEFDILSCFISDNKGIDGADLSTDGTGGQYKANLLPNGISSIGMPLTSPNQKAGSSWQGFALPNL